MDPDAPRPVAADAVGINRGAVSVDDSTEAFGVTGGEHCQVVVPVARPCVRPVDDARDPVIVDEDVRWLEVTVDEAIVGC